MKRFVLSTSILLAIIFLFVFVAFAQSDAPKQAADQKPVVDQKPPMEQQPAGEVKPKGGKETPRIDFILKKMTEKYALDEKQQASLREILSANRDQAMKDRKEAKSREELMNLGRDRLKDANTKIVAILIPEQLEKYNKSHEEFNRWMHERWEMRMEHREEMKEKHHEQNEEMENNEHKDEIKEK